MSIAKLIVNIAVNLLTAILELTELLVLKTRSLVELHKLEDEARRAKAFADAEARCAQRKRRTFDDDFEF